MRQLSKNPVTTPRTQLSASAAILLIHWQYDVVAPEGALGETFSHSVGERNVIANTAALVARGRSAGAQIIHVIAYTDPNSRIANNALWNTVGRSGRFMMGTKGVTPIEELAAAPGDALFYHTRISSFHGTELLTYLIGRGVTDLYLTGVATNVAVDHTARDAVQFGFNTYVVDDCCASADMAYHDAAMMTLRVLCTGVVSALDVE